MSHDERPQKQTFFQHYIKLKTTHNQHDVDNYIELYEQFYDALKQNNEFALVDSEAYTYMVESNGCITYEFYTVFDKPISKEAAEKMINDSIKTSFTLTDKNGNIHDVTSDLSNKEYTVLETVPSSTLMFAQVDNESLLKNESDLPTGTVFLEIQGLLGQKASDPTRLNIIFYDKDSNPLMFEKETPVWIKDFKAKFNNTFTVRDQMFIEYKHIIKLLTGAMTYSFDFWGQTIHFKNERSLIKKAPTEKQLLNQSISMLYREPKKEYYY